MNFMYVQYIMSFLTKNKKVKIHNVDQMYGLGTPEDLETFIRNKK